MAVDSGKWTVVVSGFRVLSLHTMLPTDVFDFLPGQQKTPARPIEQFETPL